jgi:hypothetical protein
MVITRRRTGTLPLRPRDLPQLRQNGSTTGRLTPPRPFRPLSRCSGRIPALPYSPLRCFQSGSTATSPPMLLHRTAITPLTSCLTPGVHFNTPHSGTSLASHRPRASQLESCSHQPFQHCFPTGRGHRGLAAVLFVFVCLGLLESVDVDGLLVVLIDQIKAVGSTFPAGENVYVVRGIAITESALPITDEFLMILADRLASHLKVRIDEILAPRLLDVGSARK